MEWKDFGHLTGLGGPAGCEYPASDDKDFVWPLGASVDQKDLSLIQAAGGRVVQSHHGCGDHGDYYGVLAWEEATKRGLICPRCGKPEVETYYLRKYGACQRCKPWRK